MQNNCLPMQKRLPSDAKGLPSDAKGLPSDAEGLPSDAKGLPSDAKELLSDRMLSECLFLMFLWFSHQIAPVYFQNACFERFRGLATKWPQDTIRMLVLIVFAAWPPNGPRMLLECLF